MQNPDHLIKYCRVCGDKASGFNYNGLCCESCKVFFHRNATNNKLTCPKYGNCEIDIFTRKNCAKCRLDKCFASKMVFKANKKKKLESNSTLDIHIRTILQNDDCQNINPLKLNLPQFPYLLTRKNKCGSELIAPERKAIANVQNVVGDSFVDESSLRLIGEVTSMNESFKIASMYARKIVHFCKSIPPFKQLCPNDQLIILKPFYYEIMITRLVYMFDRVNKGYPMIKNESSDRAVFMRFDHSMDFNNQDPIQQDQMQHHLNFQIELFDELDGDFTIRDLFISILLFKPRANLSNPEFVHYQYSLYCRLLRRYLKHKYNTRCKADQKYKTLIRMADGFDGHMKNAMSLAKSQFDVNQLPEAIIEIFDF